MVEIVTATDDRRAADLAADSVTSSELGERRLDEFDPTTGEVMRVVAEWINDPNANTAISAKELIKRYLGRHPDDEVMESRLRVIENYEKSEIAPPATLGELDKAMQVTIERPSVSHPSSPIDHPDLIVINEVNRLILAGQYHNAMTEVGALSAEACDLRLSALERIYDRLSFDQPAMIPQTLRDEISRASGEVTNRALDACKAPFGDTQRVIDAWYITRQEVDYGRAQAMITLCDQHDEEKKIMLLERLVHDRSEHIRRSALRSA